MEELISAKLKFYGQNIQTILCGRIVFGAAPIHMYIYIYANCELSADGLNRKNKFETLTLLLSTIPFVFQKVPPVAPAEILSF